MLEGVHRSLEGRAGPHIFKKGNEGYPPLLRMDVGVHTEVWTCGNATLL